MKKTLIALLAFILTACANTRNISSVECAVMKSVIKDIMKEDRVKTLTIANEYRKWNIDLNLDFKIDSGPFHEPPKSTEEREQRLNSIIADPYPMYYVFAFPFTDTLFTKKDKEFMKMQVRNDTTKHILCKIKNVKFVNAKDGGNGYIFFKPIFSENYEYAIIQKYTNYDIVGDDNTIFGEIQTLYYKYDKEKGWIRFFAGEKWF